MDARKKIEEEKLFNILNPKKANRDFKITLKFQKHLSPKYDKAYKLATRNKYFLEEGKGDNKKVYASFFPEDTEDLHQLFDLVHHFEDTEIFLNNKRIPYIQDLWLFLMWFHRIK